MRTLFLLILISASIPAISVAESKKEEAKPEEKKEIKRDLPKSGVLASTVNSRDEGVQIPETWNDKTGEPAPLTASINPKGPGQWEIGVSNGSEDMYYGFFQVEFKNSKGTTIKTDSFAATLKPKESVKRNTSGPADAGSINVALLSWKNLSEKKKKDKDGKDKDKADEKKREPSNPSDNGYQNTMPPQINEQMNMPPQGQ